MSAGDRGNRGSIFLESAPVLAQEACRGGQFRLQLLAPRCAAAATPGSFIHLSCGPARPLRRPLSLLRADPATGRIEVLYKVIGPGLAALAALRPGEVVSCLGPIGRGFAALPARQRALLIGGGVGLPPLVFLAESMATQPAAGWQPLLLAGSEIPFPFPTGRATIPVAGTPGDATHALPFLEERGIANRLASRAGLPGCHAGFVTDLAAAWLAALAPAERAVVAVYACGPPPMLQAAAALAGQHELPCQVSLEERMACGVGGCAGCAVQVATPDGPAMQRVCVDGPVFDADAVFA